MIKAVIFDFDGVLVDSEKAKEDAYYAVFRDADKKIIDDALLNFNRQPRSVVIENILKEMGVDVDAELFDRIGRFGEVADRKVLEAPEISGARQALEYLGLDLFLLSSTPDKPLREVLEKRDFSKYFKAVYGSDSGSKTVVASKIIEENNYSPDEVVLVGDGLSDQRAADNLGIRFIGVLSSAHNLPENLELALPDLRGLPELLKKLSP